MSKVVKIFDNEKEKYSGNCYVNTVIFRGSLPQTPKLFGSNTVKFSVQLSGGKDDKTGADCAAFGEVGQKILNNYSKHDNIWIIARYRKQKIEGKFYHEFIVREVITQEEIDRAAKDIEKSETKLDDDLPF